MKLLDFGIARATTDGTVTKTGELIGTPAFMSPEQVRGDPLDQQSDLFSLGVTLQAAIRGDHRFRGLESTQMLLRSLLEPTAPLLEEAQGMPVALDSVLAALTALQPALRVADARAALAMLRASGLAADNDEALLAAWVADHLAETTVVARRENSAAAARELAFANELQQRPGAEAAAFLALDRAASLEPTPEALQRREAWATTHGFSLGEPTDPAPRQRLNDAVTAWRQQPQNPALCRRIADLYQAARCPRQHAIHLWRYVRERADDTHALQQLCVLLDGPGTAHLTQARLSTRSIVAGIRTGGKASGRPSPHPAAVVVQRRDPSDRPPAKTSQVAGVVGGSPLSSSTSLAGRALLALVVVAGAILVVRLAVDTAGAAKKTLAVNEQALAERQITAEVRSAARRLIDADQALAAHNWALARTLATEVLATPSSLDEAQQARAIRARASVGVGDVDAARADLEAYRSRVVRDDDPFLREANALLTQLRSAPADPQGRR